MIQLRVGMKFARQLFLVVQRIGIRRRKREEDVADP
jgi:hypothetical protein